MGKESFMQEPLGNSDDELREAEVAMRKNEELSARGGILDRLQAASNYKELVGNLKKARMHQQRDSEARRRAE
jgi:hypothetical protein